MSKYITKKQPSTQTKEVWKNYTKSLYLTFLKPEFKSIEEC